MTSSAALAEYEAAQAELTPYQAKDSFTPEEFAELESKIKQCDEKALNYQRSLDVEKAMQSHAQKALELRRPVGMVPGMRGNLDAERESLALNVTDPRQGWGKSVVDSAEFKAFQGNARPNFRLDLEGKALLVSSEVAIPAYRNEIVPIMYPPLIVSGLFNVVPVSSGVVNWIQEVSFTNAADWVAEGVLKPESAKDFGPQTIPIQKIAHFLKVTNETLEDTPQIRALLDGNLRGGLMRKVENDLVNGSGTPPAIRGLLNFALPAAPAGETAYASIYNGIVTVEAAGFMPNGILMNPLDWGALRQTTIGTPAVYFGGDPTQAGTKMVEGVRVIATSAVPAGTVIVGDFSHAILFQRSAVEVRSGLEGRDFVMNIVTLVCEARLALTIDALPAFAEVTLPVVTP